MTNKPLICSLRPVQWKLKFSKNPATQCYLSCASFEESTIWCFAAGGFVWKKIHREKKKKKSPSFLSQQRGADGCGCGWCDGGGEVVVLVLMLPCHLVVCGVGATVYVVIVLQAVLGCSHHVWGFHRGSENRQDETQMLPITRNWLQTNYIYDLPDC